MSIPTTSNPTRNVISSPGSASGRTPCATPDGPTTGKSGPDLARASLSARQADALGLQAGLAGWPTPMAGTPAQNGNNQAGNTDSGRKTEAMCGKDVAGHGLDLTGWMTPWARGDAGGDRWTRGEIKNSEDEIRYNLITPFGPTRLTPSGEILTGSAAGMENGGQLNPAHSRWLMGLPVEWDVCAPMATRSSRRKQKRS
jgi:hypothetical protein